MESDTGGDTSSQRVRPVEPVPALPYQAHPESGWRVEPGFVVAAAMAAGALGVLSFSMQLWMCSWPGLFRTVAAFTSFASVEFAMSLAQAIPQAAMAAGAGAYFLGRPAARTLLRVGSAGVLLFQVVGYAYYTFTYRTASSSATAADTVVMSVWQAASMLYGSVVPLLILLMTGRPRVKAPRSNAGAS